VPIELSADYIVSVFLRFICCEVICSVDTI